MIDTKSHTVYVGWLAGGLDLCLPSDFEAMLPVSYEYEPRDLKLIKEYCESTPDYDAYLAPAFSIRFNTNLIDSAQMIYHTVEAVQGNRIESIRVECVMAVKEIIEERGGTTPETQMLPSIQMNRAA